MAKEVGKVILAAGVTVGVIILASKLINKASDVDTLANKFGFDLSVSSFKVSGTSLLIGVQVNISNPTKTELTIQKPYLEVKYKADSSTEPVVLAKTKVSDTEKVTILAQNNSLINFTFTIPILSNFSIFKQIVSKIIQNVNWTDYQNIPTQLSENIDKIYQYFTIDALVYVGGQPFNYEFPLA